ncbi:hypothetical protein [Nonomuraea sp. NPDC049158]|uniref:hypothetical protein n=1 Tax=Nonomuraea sp. NPDC049158 TaxID=3155649 RepID=UPI00340003A5
MTAAMTGTRRPRRTGTQRGHTSPHSLTSPTARRAAPSLTTLSRRMYHHPFSCSCPAGVGPGSSSGASKMKAAMRHRLEGSTASGMA